MLEIRIATWGSVTTASNPYTHILSLLHLHTHSQSRPYSYSPSQTPPITSPAPQASFPTRRSIGSKQKKEIVKKKLTDRLKTRVDLNKRNNRRDKKKHLPVFSAFDWIQIRKTMKEPQTITYQANRRHLVSKWERKCWEKETLTCWFADASNLNDKKRSLVERRLTRRVHSRETKRMWTDLQRTVLYISSLSFVLWLSLSLFWGKGWPKGKRGSWARIQGRFSSNRIGQSDTYVNQLRWKTVFLK